MALHEDLTADTRERTTVLSPPEILDPARQADCARLFEIRARGVATRDTLDAQLSDLAQSRRPGRKLSGPSLEAAKRSINADVPLAEFGRWVHFSWRPVLVRVLPPQEFAELRTNRNRYKILPAEQAKLANATVAIAGLSVGLAIATTIALEGIGARIHLADHDDLSLSNLNRLLAGVTELGMNKAVLAATRLWEVNPYLDIRLFQTGVSDANAASFLENVDLLIEECDDLYMKVRLRELCRTRRIPVLCETSDRGTLDIERFDLEPDRPLLHGRIGTTTAAELAGLSTKQKIPFVVSVLGHDMSAKLAASLMEVNESIWTWPQLGADVTLGGATASHFARRILSGHDVPSGRVQVDLDTYATVSCEGPAFGERELTEPFPHVPSVPECSASAGDHAKAPDLLFIAQAASLAPSGGNAQGWQFSATKHGLALALAPSQPSTQLDFERRASVLALGAAAEIALHASTALGFPSSLVVRDSTLELELRPRSQPDARGYREHCARHTNRRRGDGTLLGAAQIAALHGVVREDFMHLVPDREAMVSLGELLGDVDRFRLLNETTHRELYGELRFTHDQARATRDGIDLATLELEPWELAGIRLAARRDVIERLRTLGGGRALRDGAVRDAAGAAAYLFLRASDTTFAGIVNAGRDLQRVWARANALGLGVQPWAPILYLVHRLDARDCAAFSCAEIAELEDFRRRLRKIYPAFDSRAVMLLRLAHAPTARARSLRRVPVVVA